MLSAPCFKLCCIKYGHKRDYQCEQLKVGGSVVKKLGEVQDFV